MKNALYFQSGGPTSVINASFYGVIKAYLDSLDEVDKLYASRYGVEGVISQDLIEIEKDLSKYEEIKSLNGAILGSSRLKLSKDTTDNNYSKIIDTVKKFNIGYILVNGGNDSMDTADRLNKFFKEKNIDTVVVGIPKTVDNDLMLIDHTPGFASACKFVVRTIMEISLDINVYKKGRVTIVEIMGRDAGWLGASALLASRYSLGPDLIYVPESPFSKEKFLEDVNKVYKEKGRCLVCVSEALKDERGEYISTSTDEVDAFGHVQLGSVGKYLDDLVSNNLNLKTRHIELSLLQRAASHIQSKVDVEEAINVGYLALKHALKHEEGMVSIIRDSSSPYKVHYELVPLKDVANGVRHLPQEYLSKEGNYINKSYEEYILPFIDEDEIKIESAHLFIK